MPEALHMNEVAGNPLWDAGKGFFGFNMMSFAMTQCCSKSAAETGPGKDEGDWISYNSCSHFRQNPGTFFLTVCLHAKDSWKYQETGRQQSKKHRDKVNIKVLFSQPWAFFLPLLALPSTSFPNLPSKTLLSVTHTCFKPFLG